MMQSREIDVFLPAYLISEICFPSSPFASTLKRDGVNCTGTVFDTHADLLMGLRNGVMETYLLGIPMLGVVVE
eukprot:TRINITY_DN7124_c0_g1_i1.p2 TRINITY_DN7124_c0_g1~~TRINITY_DN7124_c0_g1_i1.p2  ORF type:complete len:73 (+),score=4.35 TRINITY_DN7124_c0_g1_i1:148-366(+)